MTNAELNKRLNSWQSDMPFFREAQTEGRPKHIELATTKGKVLAKIRSFRSHFKIYTEQKNMKGSLVFRVWKTPKTLEEAKKITYKHFAIDNNF